MRVRFTLCVLFFFLCAAALFCVPDGRVSVMPKDVYVGDEAEIRFEFAFAEKLFEGDSPSLNVRDLADVSDLPEEVPPGSRSENEELKRIFFTDDYTIQSLRLKGSPPSYVLSIVFIPWKTGEIDMSAFDLSPVLGLSVRPFLTDIPPIHIQSITEKTGEKQLRPVKGPIIIPGTTYAVAAFCAVLLLFFAVVTALLIRFALIRVFFQAFFERMFSSQSFRAVCRELLFLEKRGQALPSGVFCTRVSRLIRSYLENRFSYPFTAKTSSELVPAFSDFFAHSASERSYAYMQDLYEVCARCDYIRFSGESVFPREERSDSVQRVRSALLYFEQPEEREAENQKTEEAV